MEFDKKVYTQKNNELNQKAKKRISVENNKCLICNKDLTSCCYSHSIPRHILKKMSLKNGELIPYKNAVRENILTKITKGKSNSSLFRNICRDCDQLFFSELDNMDIINNEWNNKILRLQAARILLYEMYRLKEFSYSYFELDKQFYSEQFIKTQQKDFIKKHDYYLKKFQDLLNNEENEFRVVYSKILDYEINFATVNIMDIDINPFIDTIIVPGHDDILKMESYEDYIGFLNIIYLDKDEASSRFIYFVALPYNGKTKIIIFCDKNSVGGIILQNDFAELNETRILNYISATLLIHGDNIYGNELFLESVRKCSRFFKDIKLRKYYNGIGLETRIIDIMELYACLNASEYNIFNN